MVSQRAPNRFRAARVSERKGRIPCRTASGASRPTPPLRALTRPWTGVRGQTNYSKRGQSVRKTVTGAAARERARSDRRTSADRQRLAPSQRHTDQTPGTGGRAKPKAQVDSGRVRRRLQGRPLRLRAGQAETRQPRSPPVVLLLTPSSARKDSSIDRRRRLRKRPASLLGSGQVGRGLGCRRQQEEGHPVGRSLPASLPSPSRAPCRSCQTR